MSIILHGRQDLHTPCTLIVYVTLPLTLYISPLASGTHIGLVGVDGTSCTHLASHARSLGVLGGGLSWFASKGGIRLRAPLRIVEYVSYSEISRLPALVSLRMVQPA